MVLEDEDGRPDAGAGRLATVQDTDAAMVSNAMITYECYLPPTTLLGHLPREFYSRERGGLSAASRALAMVLDAMEIALRLRLASGRCHAAKDSILLQRKTEDRATFVADSQAWLRGGAFRFVKALRGKVH